MKKSISLLLLCVLLFSLGTQAFASGSGGTSQFADVDNGAWYANAVTFVCNRGLMIGTAPAIFSPDMLLTNAQLVTILWRMAGSPPMPAEGTEREPWYAEAARWAAAVQGAETAGFDPNAAASKEETAVRLWDYARSIGADVSVGEDTNILSYFDAFDITGSAVPAVQWAVGAGVMDSTEDGYFNPTEPLTRAQAAMLLLRLDAAIAQNRPVIGVAWVSVTDSEFFTNVFEAIRAAGGEPVALDQVMFAGLPYEDGKLTDGVAETGALTEEAGRKMREISWEGSNAAEVLAGIDAVVFSGGEDISPSLFLTQVPWHGIEAERDYCAERDASDYLLMDYCLDMDIPFMGFCRGMQMLGVVSGGEVIQDIPTYFADLSLEYNFEHRNEKSSPDAYRNYSSHSVQVAEKDSVLNDIIGGDTVDGCPSWHHQALKSVSGTLLRVTGVTPTGGVDMIEAIERSDKSFAVGFQFHPEAVIARTLDIAGDTERFMDYDTALSFYAELVKVASAASEANEKAA